MWFYFNPRNSFRHSFNILILHYFHRPIPFADMALSHPTAWALCLVPPRGQMPFLLGFVVRRNFHFWPSLFFLNSFDHMKSTRKPAFYQPRPKWRFLFYYHLIFCISPIYVAVAQIDQMAAVSLLLAFHLLLLILICFQHNSLFSKHQFNLIVYSSRRADSFSSCGLEKCHLKNHCFLCFRYFHSNSLLLQFENMMMKYSFWRIY